MTKHIKWMSAVLLAALIAVPAFAQTEKQTVSKVAKAVEQAALKARQKAQQKICAYCGEEITSRYQHCSAKNYTGLCSETKEEYKSPATSAQDSRCPKCGEGLTIDERYHGVEHHCKCNAQTAAQKPVCAYCGEEITSQGQHCSAQNYISLCSQTKIQHRHTKYEDAASHCPKCGEELTIDERYHGVKHHCNPAAEQQTKYCIYCGEEIKTEGQVCTEGGKCTVYCPECHADLRDPANISPDGIHHCRFKVHIKPVPAKK